MNQGEIYNKILNYVWGDTNASPPPVSEVQHIRDMINHVRTKIQQDYNYWFMRNEFTINAQDGIISYSLPDDFKEIISCRVREDDHYSQPLRLIDEREKTAIESSKPTNGYPVQAFIDGANIMIYPPPEGDKEILLDYYRILPSYWGNLWPQIEDGPCKFLPFAIIYEVVSDLKAKRGETTEANFYYRKAQIEIEQTQNEDFARRQSPQVIF